MDTGGCRGRQLLDEAEFVIIPVLNVDGYVYTWTNDHLWRKNRRPPPAGGTCYGIDLNRNYAVSDRPEWAPLHARCWALTLRWQESRS